MRGDSTALLWARAVAVDCGRRDGTRILVELSQSELARRQAVSTGTVGYYLDQLGPAVLSRRPIVLDATTLGVGEPPAARFGTTTGVAAVLDALAAIQTAQARLTTAFAGVVFANDFANLRESSRVRERFANSSRDRTDRQPVRDLSVSLTDSRTSRTTHEVREEVREPANDERVLKIDGLVAPLAKLCERRHLVGVTNRTRLHTALMPYQADQIRHAVELLTQQIEAGIPIRSPIGLLVRIAQQHDTTYFRSEPGKAPASSHETIESDPLEATWPDELTAELDHEIDLDLQRLPTTIRSRLLADSNSLDRLRAGTYQRRTTTSR